MSEFLKCLWCIALLALFLWGIDITYIGHFRWFRLLVAACAVAGLVSSIVYWTA